MYFYKYLILDFIFIVYYILIIRNIEVGEEMTWDYGYTVDAVPFKVLYCYCGEPNCRIRLL